MNAIPQKAHNYERIQIPRNIPSNRNQQPQRTGKVTDMQAYNMQKIAMQRRKAYEERMAYEAQRRQARQMQLYYEEEQRREREMRQYREQQRREREYREQQRREREMQQRRQQQLRAERETYVRQTNVKNIVGGRKLTPAYEVGVSYGAGVSAREYRDGYDRGYERRNVPRAGRATQGYEEREARYAARPAYGTAAARPVARSSYAAPKRAPIHGFDMVETQARADQAAYRGVKPIAVEYEAPRRKGIVSTIIIIALIFAMLAGIVIRYAQISDMNRQNTQIENRIAALSQELDGAKVESALQKDLSTIRQRAASELNMSEPKDSQIVYLPADTSDDAAAAVPATSDAAAGMPDAGVQDQGAADSGITQEGTVTIDETGQADASVSDGIADFFKTIADTIKGWFPN